MNERHFQRLEIFARSKNLSKFPLMGFSFARHVFVQLNSYFLEPENDIGRNVHVRILK